jgi:TM2 domain-containing membrane protein YozV
VDADRIVERGIAVFANWGVFGAIAVGFLMEGVTREAYALSLIGVAAVIVGFVGHLIVNAHFDQSFSRGETSLGLAALAAVSLIFAVAWLSSRLADATVWTGLTLIAALVGAAAVYLGTRFGLKETFSQFHRRAERGRR